MLLTREDHARSTAPEATAPGVQLKRRPAAASGTPGYEAQQRDLMPSFAEGFDRQLARLEVLPRETEVAQARGGEPAPEEAGPSEQAEPAAIEPDARAIEPEAEPEEPEVASEALEVGRDGDAFEQEADAVADLAASGAAPAAEAVEGPAKATPEAETCPTCGPAKKKGEGDCPACKAAASKGAPGVQRKGAGEAPARGRLPSLAGGSELAPAVRERAEPHLGDLSGVRVHTGDKAQATAEAYGARALTSGSDIVLGKGESATDVRLMTHEATHVKQQGAAGGAPQVQRLGLDDVADAVVPDWIKDAVRGAMGSMRSIAAGVPGKARGTATGMLQQANASEAGAKGAGQAAGQAASAAATGIKSQGQAAGQALQGSAGAKMAAIGAQGMALNALAPKAEHALDPVGPALPDELQAAGAEHLGAAAEVDSALPVQRAFPSGEAPAPAPAGALDPDAGAKAPPIAEPAAVQDVDPEAAPAQDAAAKMDEAADASQPLWSCSEAEIVSKASRFGRDVIDKYTDNTKLPGVAGVQAFVKRHEGRIQQIGAGLKLAAKHVANPIGTSLDNALSAAGTDLETLGESARSGIESVKADAKESIVAPAKGMASAVAQQAQAVPGMLRSEAVAAGARIKGVYGSVSGWLTKYPMLARTVGIVSPGGLIAGAVKGAIDAGAWLAPKLKTVGEKALAFATKLVDEKVKQFQALYVVVKGVVNNHKKVVKVIASEKKKELDTLLAGADSAVAWVTGKKTKDWADAANEKVAELKGEACAAVGPVAGPCVRSMLPQPGKDMERMANLTVKGELTVPYRKIFYAKIAGGASLSVKAVGKSGKYVATVEGEGTVTGGVGGDPTGKAGVTANAGSIAGGTDGSIGKRLKALTKLGGASGAPKALPAPGPDPTDLQPEGNGLGGPGLGLPITTNPGKELKEGEGGMAVGAKAGGGVKSKVTAIWEFDATNTKDSTCDGAGGLATFVAASAGAQVLPAPFSSLAQNVTNAAFPPKSVEVGASVVGEGSVEAGPDALKLKGEVATEQGARVKVDSGEYERRNDEGKLEKVKGASSTLTLFQTASGKGGLESFGIAGNLTASGGTELAITYGLPGGELANIGLTQKATVSAGIDAAHAALARFHEAAHQVGYLKGFLKYPNKAEIAIEFKREAKNIGELLSRLDGILSSLGADITAADVWKVIAEWSEQYTGMTVTVTGKLAERLVGVRLGAGGTDAEGGAKGTGVGLNFEIGESKVLWTGSVGS